MFLSSYGASYMSGSSVVVDAGHLGATRYELNLSQSADVQSALSRSSSPYLPQAQLSVQKPGHEESRPRKVDKASMVNEVGLKGYTRINLLCCRQSS